MPVVTPSRASTVTVYAVPQAVLVDPEHRRQVEPVGVGLGHRHADVAGGVADHERHELGRRELGGEDQVALVLAVLVVDDDDRPAALDGGDGGLDGVQAGQRAAHRPPSEQALHVLGDHVDLQVDGLPRGARTERGLAEGGGDEADLEPGVGVRMVSARDGADRADGERDAVHGDRALLDDVAGELGRQRDAHDLPVLAGLAGDDVPTPSTWPCIRCPPRRVCGVTARSRLTGDRRRRRPGCCGSASRP